MVLVERWTGVADDRIDYRFTVIDPQTWSKPWFAAIAWNKTGTLHFAPTRLKKTPLWLYFKSVRSSEKSAKL